MGFLFKNTSINKCYMIFADDNECNSLVYIGYYLEMSFDENYNMDDDVCINESSFISFNLFVKLCVSQQKIGSKRR